MAFRRIALSLLIVVGVFAACGGDDDGAESGVALDDTIGAPQESGYEDAAEPSVGPSIVKTASLEVGVVAERLSAAAQDVIDIATDPKVGGFLVSSLVDTETVSGEVVVKVPSPSFENVVAELDGVGDVTRQELAGEDLTEDFLSAHAQVQRARNRTDDLLTRLERTKDRAVRFELRQELSTASDELRAFEDEQTFIDGQTAYSAIDVGLYETAPPPPPAEPALERAFGTAKSVTLAIVSGVLVVVGAVAPVAALLVLLYLIGAPIIRRLRPRLGS